MSSIQFSEKYGLNPSVEQCFVCLQGKGLILFGRLKGEDKEAPRTMCLGHDSEPCDECKKHMEQGIILISVRDEEPANPNNPFRTGGWVVLKEEAFKRMFQGGSVAQVLKRRMAFMPDSVWDAIGLPRESTKEKQCTAP